MLKRQKMSLVVVNFCALVLPFLVCCVAVVVDLALFADIIRRIVFAPFLFVVLMLIETLVVRVVVVVLRKVVLNGKQA